MNLKAKIKQITLEEFAHAMCLVDSSRFKTIMGFLEDTPEILFIRDGKEGYYMITITEEDE